MPIYATSLIMLALPISKSRFKALSFYQNSVKIKLFLQKNAKFLSAGAPPPDSQISPPPPLRISGYAPANTALQTTA